MLKTILIIIALSSIKCSKYEKDGNVLILTNENIDQALSEFDHVFIKFFAP